MRFVNLTDQRFGRLVAVQRVKNRGRYIHWFCICDCGKTTVAGANNLRQGVTRSCGCYKTERLVKASQYDDPQKVFWNSKIHVLGLDACWEWKGRVNNGGYGSFTNILAHRYAYETKIGTIPKGLCVLHRCDNPRCCNPRHLFLGSYQDNFKDALTKGRTFYQKHPEAYPKGENHANAVLTWPIVRAIRNKYATGKYRQIDLAREYGTTQAAVSQLIRNVAWREQGGAS